MSKPIVHTPLVKICGLTNLEDTLAAIEFGADLLGFNFYPDSPRFLELEEASRIFQEIPSSIPKVGVFVNTQISDVIDCACELELDWIQFHGDESAEDCNPVGHPWMRAFRPKTAEDLEEIEGYDCDWILVDAASASYGGSGKKANWDLAKQAKNFGKKVFLAGGLTPENVAEAVAFVAPFGVDVASGVEKNPQKKDIQKMEQFIRRAKQLPTV